jgi:hypothetical protein
MELERLNNLLKLLDKSAVEFFQAITLVELRKLVQMALVLKQMQMLDLQMHMVCATREEPIKEKESWL